MWDSAGQPFEGVTIAAAEPQGGDSFVVQADDWLSKIAEKAFGDAMAWPAIWQGTNRMAAEDDSFAALGNPNIIEPGQKLWIPRKQADLVKAGEGVGHIFIDVPAGTSGHVISASGPAAVIDSPFSGVPTARLTASFTPQAPGSYELIFLLNGGTMVETFVDAN